MYNEGNVLGEKGEWAYSSAVSSTCDSSDSMPDRSCSRDLEIWPSWLFDGRFSDKARWRSSNESLMWSASRNSWGGLVAMTAVVKGGCGSSRGGCCVCDTGRAESGRREGIIENA
jgi:hypothetical protein